jgi:hypothetical protein
VESFTEKLIHNQIFKVCKNGPAGNPSRVGGESKVFGGAYIVLCNRVYDFKGVTNMELGTHSARDSKNVY